MNLKPCKDPRVCGVQNHRPGTVCRAEASSRPSGPGPKLGTSTLPSAASGASSPADRPQRPRSNEVRFYPGDNSDHADELARSVEGSFRSDPDYRLRVHTTSGWATGVPGISKRDDMYVVNASVHGSRDALYETDDLADALEYAANRYSFTDEDRADYLRNEDDDF